MSANVIPFAPVKPKPRKGSFLEHLTVKAWREVSPPKNARPFDQFFACHISGDSLSGDGIFDGDYALARKPFELSEITRGRLAAVSTPLGLLVKHVHIGFDGIRLESSNPDYEDLWFPPDDVEIVGIVVRVERDYE
jgi:SOS-response transcriptional repressor LexA